MMRGSMLGRVGLFLGIFFCSGITQAQVPPTCSPTPQHLQQLRQQWNQEAEKELLWQLSVQALIRRQQYVTQDLTRVVAPLLDSSASETLEGVTIGEQPPVIIYYDDHGKFPAHISLPVLRHAFKDARKGFPNSMFEDYAAHDIFIGLDYSPVTKDHSYLQLSSIDIENLRMGSVLIFPGKLFDGADDFVPLFGYSMEKPSKLYLIGILLLEVTEDDSSFFYRFIPYLQDCTVEQSVLELTLLDLIPEKHRKIWENQQLISNTIERPKLDDEDHDVSFEIQSRGSGYSTFGGIEGFRRLSRRFFDSVADIDEIDPEQLQEEENIRKLEQFLGGGSEETSVAQDFSTQLHAGLNESAQQVAQLPTQHPEAVAELTKLGAQAQEANISFVQAAAAMQAAKAAGYTKATLEVVVQFTQQGIQQASAVVHAIAFSEAFKTAMLGITAINTGILVFEMADALFSILESSFDWFVNFVRVGLDWILEYFASNETPARVQEPTTTTLSREEAQVWKNFFLSLSHIKRILLTLHNSNMDLLRILNRLSLEIESLDPENRELIHRDVIFLIDALVDLQEKEGTNLDPDTYAFLSRQILEWTSHFPEKSEAFKELVRLPFLISPEMPSLLEILGDHPIHSYETIPFFVSDAFRKLVQTGYNLGVYISQKALRSLKENRGNRPILQRYFQRYSENQAPMIGQSTYGILFNNYEEVQATRIHEYLHHVFASDENVASFFESAYFIHKKDIVLRDVMYVDAYSEDDIPEEYSVRMLEAILEDLYFRPQEASTTLIEYQKMFPTDFFLKDFCEDFLEWIKGQKIVQTKGQHAAAKKIALQTDIRWVIDQLQHHRVGEAARSLIPLLQDYAKNLTSYNDGTFKQKTENILRSYQKTFSKIIFKDPQVQRHFHLFFTHLFLYEIQINNRTDLNPHEKYYGLKSLFVRDIEFKLRRLKDIPRFEIPTTVWNKMIPLGILKEGMYLQSEKKFMELFPLIHRNQARRALDEGNISFPSLVYNPDAIQKLASKKRWTKQNARTYVELREGILYLFRSLPRLMDFLKDQYFLSSGELRKTDLRPSEYWIPFLQTNTVEMEYWAIRMADELSPTFFSDRNTLPRELEVILDFDFGHAVSYPRIRQIFFDWLLFKVYQ
ncbi:MAG: hypothetical protein R3A11_03835 [Bdellovibrionota bacterium]